MENLQVIIDKRNPVIAQIEQFRDRHLQFFQWNYSQEEVVQDFTSYTYAVYLDNRVYEPNLKYMREGKHTLEVTAKDAAENVSKAAACFVIDRTAPEILFQNAEEGKTYEKEVEVSVQLENEEDLFETIIIDGERQKTDGKEPVFRYLFQDAGVHEIQVSAADLAGNRSDRKIRFEVKEKKAFLQKLMDSGITERKAESEGGRERRGQSGFWGIGIVFVFVGAGIWIIIRRRKRTAKK